MPDDRHDHGSSFSATRNINMGSVQFPGLTSQLFGFHDRSTSFAIPTPPFPPPPNILLARDAHCM